jgi:CMP/dCMP kinase
VPVITISRQFGTAGRAIGEELARRFGAEFLDREIVAAVAARAGIPESEAEGYDEQLPSLWQRVATVLATTTPDLAMPPLPAQLAPSPAVHERLAELTHAVITEAAERGNAVILGRGAAFVVGRGPGTLHAKLRGSLEDRVRALVARMEEVPESSLPDDGIPDEAALRELCQSMDARRAQYVRRLYDADWLDASHYDVSIDVWRIGVQPVIDILELAARRRESQA